MLGGGGDGGDGGGVFGRGGVFSECNDRPFYMVVLVGYSVAGRRIVVLVRSGQMSLSGQPRVVASSRHDSCELL